MVRHDNMIPNGHFHKQWQKHLKTWFDQPMKKLRRRNQRDQTLRQTAPRPVKILRPIVHCPTIRYNARIRAGRGFTLQELKRAGINKKFARTIGISVDFRRRNRCYETIAQNCQRLSNYRNKLILFKRNFKKNVSVVNDGRNLNKISQSQVGLKVKKLTDEEKKFQAFVTLRRARTDAKYAGKRLKKKMSKTDALEGGKILTN